MRKHVLCAVVLCAAVFLNATSIHAQTIVAADEAVAGRVIVKFKAGSPLLAAETLPPTARPAKRAQGLAQRLRLPLSAGPAITERTQVLYASGFSSAALAQRLALEDDIEYAVPDGRKRIVTVPNDPLYASGVPGNGPAAGQWYLRAPSGAVQSSLDIETAWNITQGDPNVVVAVVDTGVRYDHPDLMAAAAGGKLLPGYDMISDPVVANDGDGRDADASDPGDWVTAGEANHRGGPFFRCTPRDPSTGQFVSEDSSWHGTQVSGVIAAITNNGIGMASVGPNLRILPVRVLGKCYGYDSDIIAGMRWAAGLPVPGVPANPTPARVINLSLGGEGACDSAYADAVNEITAAGAVIVAAAGNTEGSAVNTPANCSGVIAVAALRHVGTKVGFSSLGPEVAISAPGGNCVNTAPGSPCLYPILTTSDSGTTVPAGPIYTDSYNISVGTSFSSPLVAGTAALLLSVQPTLTPHQVRIMLQATARPFATTSDDAGVPQCSTRQYDSFGNPITQDECFCTVDTCGAGMLNAGAALTAAAAGTAAASVQAQGLWWAAPAMSESGWGINFAHDGDTIFASWFTYDPIGKGLWLVMTAQKSAPDTYAGTLYTTTGPAFNAVPFVPSQVVPTQVGTGTLTFTDVTRGTFAYVVNAIAQTKTITRELFGPLPVCAAATASLGAATNYTDLWWASPAGSESGWGINLTQEGAVIFATWFTYDVDHSPMWLVVTAPKTAPGTYSGTLYRTTGPAFNAVPFNPANVVATAIGTATFTFSDGNNASFAYTVNGVSQTKAITREVLQNPGTVCH
jgi:serine protease